MGGPARKFEIVASGYYSCSVEEFLRASSATESELPQLTTGQKEFTRRFGLPEQDYARHLLANRYGRDRIVRGAQELGRAIERILCKSGNGWRLLAIKVDLSNGPKVARFQTGRGITEVNVPPEVAAALLRRGTLEDEERKTLKNALRSHLGRTEPIGKRKRE